MFDINKLFEGLKDLLRIYLDNQNLPEAPVSFNIKCYDKNGLDCQLTIRAKTGKELMEKIPKTLDWLTAKGFSSSKYDNNSTSNGNSNSQPLPLPSGPATMEAQLNPEFAEASAKYTTFSAENMVASMHNGKTYWKILGGKYAKYGVTIWPEVLQVAGINPDELKPDQIYNMQGKTATVQLKDNGQPQKVIKLQ